MRTVQQNEYNNRNVLIYMYNLLRLPTKIFKSIVVIDSDTVVCGSNMLRRLAKYTVDMTRTMGQVGNIIQRTDKYGHNLQSALINSPHNTNIH